MYYINLDNDTIENNSVIEEHYCPTSDITYLMKYTYVSGDLKKMEVVAFYSGEPNEEDSQYYINHPGTTAEYTL